MLNVYPNQTMFNAYDGLIFLGPLEAMHKTAKVDFIYTKEFKQELERRYMILFTSNEISKKMEHYKAGDLPDLIDKIHVAEAQKLLPQAKTIDPISSWKEQL